MSETQVITLGGECRGAVLLAAWARLDRAGRLTASVPLPAGVRQALKAALAAGRRRGTVRAAGCRLAWAAGKGVGRG